MCLPKISSIIRVIVTATTGLMAVIAIIFYLHRSESGDASLRKVSFCEHEYVAPLVLVEGRDVIARVAAMASADPSNGMCDAFHRYATDDLLDTDINLGSDGNYMVSIDSHLFFIDTKRMVIMRAGYEDVVDLGPL